MRTARLRGRDHTALGAVECVAEGPAAIALSVGGAPKSYPHTDPNEDSVGFALAPGGALIAVADAHRGCEASAQAVDFLLGERAAAWLAAGKAPDGERWMAEALDALWAVHEHVRRATSQPDRQGSRTTLALAVWRPDVGRVDWAAIGDSHVFRVGAEQVGDLTQEVRPCPPRYFLGSESLTRDEVAERAAVGVLQAPLALVLATDGISELGVGLRDPEQAVFESVRRAAESDPDLRALETARALVERANRAHAANPSGDNVGVAVLWTGADGP